MYFESLIDKNLTYSIDMLRLTTRITYNEFSELDFRVGTVWQKYIKKKYNSSRFADFQYNYNIEIEEGISFWFGFLHNSEKRSEDDTKLYNLTIEFNPNKLKMNNVLLFILYFSADWQIKSFDLAVDIPVNILDILGFEKGRRKDIKTISSGFDNKSIYIGKTDNRLKIYNKKIESKLDIKGDLTRLEISKKFDEFPLKRVCFYHFDDVFPDLYLNNYLYSFKDYEDKTLLAILYAVQNDFPFDNLSRRYKQKVKALLEGGNKIKFSTKVASDILRKVIYHYFVQPNSPVVL